jgi:hypothetical protein
LFRKWLHKEGLDEVANVCFITPNVLVFFSFFVFPFINVRWCNVGHKTWVKRLKLSESFLGTMMEEEHFGSIQDFKVAIHF